MARGDQIYVMRPFGHLNGVYEHHGIDCGDGTVIHYSKAGNVARVSRTSLAAFAMGQPIFTKRHTVSFIPDIVLQRAESRLGEQTYNLMSNNCEHFANWCKTGRNESDQLKEFGLGVGGVGGVNADPLIQEAAQTGDPTQSLLLFENAFRNMAIAQQQLQSQYDRTQAEITTWDRVARLALKRNREDLARAALAKKVNYKRRAADFKEQLDQLKTMQDSLHHNQNLLQRRLQVG